VEEKKEKWTTKKSGFFLASLKENFARRMFCCRLPSVTRDLLQAESRQIRLEAATQV
jgi:hypothetical protein